MPVTLMFFAKRVGDNLDYYVDWNAWLDNDPLLLTDDDAITASSWRVEPSGLGLHDPGYSGRVTRVWVNGGIVGQEYRITNTILTTNGRRESRSFVVFIEDVR